MASATVYFKETFDASWEDRWVVSDWKKSDGTAGKWVHTAGKWHGDAEKDMGLQTGQDARFYAISAKFDEFTNEGKDLVLQYSIKHEQSLDCGGGYIKLLPSDLDQENFSGDSPYYIMFGPDICGSSTKKIHAIFNYDDENHLISKTPRCESDQLTHVYTFVVKPDQTYEIYVDGDLRESGEMTKDWDFLPEEFIKDPAISKPADWVDEAEIADPEDVKPAGYDDIPEYIDDEDAEMPDDWDEEDDGEWEAPQIPNPEYKGEWKPKMIPNPEYKGEWEHPLIKNPEYEHDDKIYAYSKIGAVGFELWQVKAGSIVDNIFVGDDLEEAKAFMDETFGASKDDEKAMFDEAQAKERAEKEAERLRMEEERAAMEDDEDDEDDYEDEDEEDEHEHDEL